MVILNNELVLYQSHIIILIHYLISISYYYIKPLPTVLPFLFLAVSVSVIIIISCYYISVSVII